MKKILYFMLILGLFRPIISMEALEESEENRFVYEPGPESLAELAGEAVALEAQRKYDEEGVKSFNAYLDTLPASVKSDVIYCKLINEKYRADIFISQLLEKIEISPEEGLEYFDQFCPDAKGELFRKLIDKMSLSVKESKFLNDLVDKVDDLGVLQIFVNLRDFEAIEESKESSDIFDKIHEKIQSKINEIMPKSLSSKFDEKTIKSADDLIRRFIDEGGERDFHADALREENILQELLTMDTTELQNILTYLYLGKALEPLGQLDKWGKTLLARTYIATPEQEQQLLDIIIKVLNAFDQEYPQAKKLFAQGIDNSPSTEVLFALKNATQVDSVVGWLKSVAHLIYDNDITGAINKFKNNIASISPELLSTLNIPFDSLNTLSSLLSDLVKENTLDLKGQNKLLMNFANFILSIMPTLKSSIEHQYSGPDEQQEALKEQLEETAGRYYFGLAVIEDYSDPVQLKKQLTKFMDTILKR